MGFWQKILTFASDVGGWIMADIMSFFGSLSPISPLLQIFLWKQLWNQTQLTVDFNIYIYIYICKMIFVVCVKTE